MSVLVIIFFVLLCLALLPIAIGFFTKPPEIGEFKTDANGALRPLLGVTPLPSKPAKERSEFVKGLYFLSAILFVFAGVPVLGFAIATGLYSDGLGFFMVMGIYAVLAWMWLRHVASVIKHQ